MPEIINNTDFLNEAARILENHNLNSSNKINLINLLAYSAGAMINLYLHGSSALDAAEFTINMACQDCNVAGIPDKNTNCPDEKIREWIVKGVVELPGLTLMQVTTQLHAVMLKTKEPSVEEVYGALHEFIMSISTTVCSLTSTKSLRNLLYTTSLRWLNFGLKFDILEQLCVPLTQCTSPFQFPDPDEAFMEFMEEEMFNGNVPVDTRGQIFH